MSANSQILLSANTHPGDSTEVLVGDKVKGDGFYGRADGFHTVMWNVDNFTGTIAIQGSLEVDPQDSDWVEIPFEVVSGDFTVTTSGRVTIQGNLAQRQYTADTAVESYNFKGNFVWVRVRIFDWTAGTVNSVLLNH